MRKIISSWTFPVDKTLRKHSPLTVFMVRIFELLTSIISAYIYIAMLSLVSLIVVFATFQDAYAEPEIDIKSLDIEALMNTKVVTASKFEQKLSEAPSSVSVITSDQIKKYGWRSLGEILQSVRGFYLTYDRNYSYIGVRGFGIPGDYNNRILLLVDGRRINESIYDSAQLGPEFPVDIDLIDKIEVVHGTGSSLYGASAFLATINVITKKGRNIEGVEASGEAGSFERYKTRLSYGKKYKNGVDVLVSGSYMDSNGDDRLYFRGFDSPDTNNGVAEDLDYERSKYFYLNVSYRDFDVQGNYSRRKKGIPTASYETAFNTNSHTTDESYWFSLKYEHTFSDQMTVMSRLSYQNYLYEGKYRYAWGPPYPDIVPNIDGAEGRWLLGEVQVTRPVGSRHRIILGANYQYSIKQDQWNYDKGIASNFDDNHRVGYWGVFIEDEFQLHEKIILNAGLRYDHYESFGGTTNPRIALIYLHSKETTFKAVYGSAYRSPTVYELYYSDGGIFQKPNPALNPESISTYEVILEHSFGNYRGTVLGYYFTASDLVELQTDPQDGLAFFNNSNKVKGRGFEVELAGIWEGGYEGKISYCYAETKNDRTDSVLPNSPRHLAKLNAIVPLFERKLFVGLEGYYVSKKKNVSGLYEDDYLIANVNLFNKTLIKGLEASAGVYNIFDKKYAHPGGEEHLPNIQNINQDGRTFRIKLTYAF